MKVILEMRGNPLTHFIWSRTVLLGWCVIVEWVCFGGTEGGLHSG